MDLKAIIKTFSSRPSGYLDVQRPFAVLVPLVEVDGQLHFLFEVRSAQLSQPGEICFPGGKMELGESPRETAIRETMEELHIEKNRIEVIGLLDKLITPFHVLIYPYLGFIRDFDRNQIQFSTDEVASVFTVPLSWLMNNEPEIHPISVRFAPSEGFPYHMIPSGTQYNWRTGDYPTYFYVYGDKIIWGMTAKILSSVIEALKDAAV